MDLTSLRLFVRLAEIRHLGRVAAELDLAPASASARLAGLERDLGVRLLQRSTRRMGLSAEGETFLPHARAALLSLEEGRALLGGEAEGRLRGTLSVATSASFGRQHLIPWQRAWQQKHPQLTTVLRLDDRIVDLVEQGVDLALRIVERPGDGQVAHRIADNPRHLFASPEYLARHGTPAHALDLAQHACLGWSDERRWILAQGGDRLEIPVRGPLRADHGESLRDATLAGCGIGFHSAWNTREHVRAGRLVQVLPDWQMLPAFKLWALFPGPRAVTPKARAFVVALKDWLTRSGAMAL